MDIIPKISKVNAEYAKSITFSVYLVIATLAMKKRLKVLGDADALFRLATYAVVAYTAITLFVDGLYLASAGGFGNIMNNKLSKAERKMILSAFIYFIVGTILFSIVTFLMLKDLGVIITFSKKPISTGFGRKRLRRRSNFY